MNLFQEKNLKLILNQLNKNNIKYRYNKETDFKNRTIYVIDLFDLPFDLPCVYCSGIELNLNSEENILYEESSIIDLNAEINSVENFNTNARMQVENALVDADSRIKIDFNKLTMTISLSNLKSDKNLLIELIEQVEQNYMYIETLKTYYIDCLDESMQLN